MMFDNDTWIDEERETKSRIEDADDPVNCFDQLPYGIVVDIISRLPITSLIQFSFVSRSSNSLCHDQHLVNTHLSRSLKKESPCLLLHSDYPIKNQLHFLQICDGKLEGRVRKIDTPFSSWMPEFTILGSSNGLLCLLNSLFPESIYLYNPFTRNYIDLPKNLDFAGQIVVYGYGFSPVIDDYKVVKISYYLHASKHESEVQIYSLRCNVWESKGVIPYTLENWSSPGVVVSGRIHWVSKSDRMRINGGDENMIVSCDLSDGSFNVMKKPKAGSFSRRWVSCFLAALDGLLSAAIPEVTGFEIWVMKEYGVNETWMKEYNIRVYYPESMISHQMERRSHIWRNMFGKKKVVKILWVLESGEVVLEYGGGGLVSYNPCTQTFKEIKFPGMPRLFQATLHVATLTSLKHV